MSRHVFKDGERIILNGTSGPYLQAHSYLPGTK